MQAGRPLGVAAAEGVREVRALAAASQDILRELEAALASTHARQGGPTPQPSRGPSPSSQLTGLQAEYLKRSQRVLELVAECEELKKRVGAMESAGVPEAELEAQVLQRRQDVEKKNSDLRALLKECYKLMGNVKLMQAGQPLPPVKPGATIE